MFISSRGIEWKYGLAAPLGCYKFRRCEEDWADVDEDVTMCSLLTWLHQHLVQKVPGNDVIQWEEYTRQRCYPALGLAAVQAPLSHLPS